jgi:hypothetical protein
MQDRSRWVLIVGGAGAAVAAVALLLEHESRRQRRFVEEHGGGEGGPRGGVDKKAIKDAINHAVQYARGPLVLGPNGKQKDQGLSLEDLLPRKFFADSVSDDHPKAAGSACMFLACRSAYTCIPIMHTLTLSNTQKHGFILYAMSIM